MFVMDRIKEAQVLKYLRDHIVPMITDPSMARKELINASTDCVVVENSENNNTQKSMKDETDLEFATFHLGKN